MTLPFGTYNLGLTQQDSSSGFNPGYELDLKS